MRKAVIWKYALTPGVQRLRMPEGAQMMDVGENAFMWAAVDPDAPEEERTVEVIGTGEEFDADIRRRYLGTSEIRVGTGKSKIVHVFERT